MHCQTSNDSTLSTHRRHEMPSHCGQGSSTTGSRAATMISPEASSPPARSSAPVVNSHADKEWAQNCSAVFNDEPSTKVTATTPVQATAHSALVTLQQPPAHRDDCRTLQLPPHASGHHIQRHPQHTQRRHRTDSLACNTPAFHGPIRDTRGARHGSELPLAQPRLQLPPRGRTRAATQCLNHACSRCSHAPHQKHSLAPPLLRYRGRWPCSPRRRPSPTRSSPQRR